MKKVIIMFVAAIAMAFTTTSCGSDEPTIDVTMSTVLDDPNNELTDAEKADVNNLIKNIGTFNCKTDNVDVLQNELKAFVQDTYNKVSEYVAANPKLKDTKAGLKFSTTGNGAEMVTPLTMLFNEFTGM